MLESDAARGGQDPVTGQPATLVNETDVSALKFLRDEVVPARDRDSDRDRDWIVSVTAIVTVAGAASVPVTVSVELSDSDWTLDGDSDRRWSGP